MVLVTSLVRCCRHTFQLDPVPCLDQPLSVLAWLLTEALFAHCIFHERGGPRVQRC